MYTLYIPYLIYFYTVEILNFYIKKIKNPWNHRTSLRFCKLSQL